MFGAAKGVGGGILPNSGNTNIRYRTPPKGEPRWTTGIVSTKVKRARHQRVWTGEPLI